MLHDYYGRLEDMAKKDNKLAEWHSVEEAEELHSVKLARRRSHRDSHHRSPDKSS